MASSGFHLDQLGVVGWNAGLVAVTMLAFLERKSPPIRWPLVCVATTSLTAWCVLVATYPMMRGANSKMPTCRSSFSPVLTCLGGGRCVVRDQWFGIAARSASVLVATEIATLLGTFISQPLRFWATANVVSWWLTLCLFRSFDGRERWLRRDRSMHRRGPHDVGARCVVFLLGLRFQVAALARW